MAERRPRNKSRRITFEIKTNAPLSVGEQVFITGNQQILGNWKADGFPLTRMADNIWTGSAVLPGDEAIEYKVTRGDWETEEVDAKGAIPGNSTLKAGGDTAVRRTVAGWKDTA